ncbi:MAG: hypothetical protein ACR2PH_05270 [Desulfobulbia bacterium]
MPATNKKPAERKYEFEQQLTNAINNRRRLRFRYEYDVHYRVFDPYILFKDEKGRYIIGGIRIKDESKPVKKPAACKYEVGLITDIQMSEKNFVADPRFKSVRSKYATLDILCAIDR